MEAPSDLFLRLLHESGLKTESFLIWNHFKLWKKGISDEYETMVDDGLKASMMRYIQGHLPTSNQVDIKSILASYTTLQPTTLTSALKLLNSQKIKVTCTLLGYFVSSGDAERVQQLMEGYKPLRPLFMEEVSAYGFDSPDKYHHFSRYAKSRLKLITLTSHPLFPMDNLFYIFSDRTCISETIADWLALEMSEQSAPSPDFMTLDAAAKRFAVTPRSMLAWLKANSGEIIRGNGLVYCQGVYI